MWRITIFTVNLQKTTSSYAMKRLLPLLLLSATTAFAQHRVYHSPQELTDNGLQFTVDTSASEIVIEARCSLPDNKERTGTNTQWWGIAWNNDADSLILQGRNTAFGDFSDTPVIDIIHRHNGTHRRLASIEGNVNLPSGAHTLALEWNAHGTATIAAGAKRLTVTASTPLPVPLHDTARLITSPGASIAIASVVTEWTDNPVKALQPPYAPSGIDSLIAASGIPIAGHWKYLDRETDDNLARPGGKYDLAVVPYGDELHLIYIGGAKILSDRWSTGMKKGILKKTPFHNHYDLVWYDSEMNAVEDECYATFDSEGVMTCVFPLHKSQLRFYKVP